MNIEPLEARIAPAEFVVSNSLDAGLGSLRQAILDANALMGVDIIQFTVPYPVIRLSTHLPAITETVSINPASNVFNRISIDGSIIAGADEADHGSGLTLLGKSSSNSTINGLTIYGFDRAGIEIVDSSFNRITSNTLGTDGRGTPDKPQMAEGILINGGTENKIGEAQKGNVINANDIGIRVTGGASGTMIDYNTIGTNASNSNETGILIESARGTKIGAEGGNTITSNRTFGIKLANDARDTTIVRNKIGTTQYSTGGTQEWGIFVDNARNTTIGWGAYFSDPYLGNEITGNSAGGIFLRAGPNSSDLIGGNYIGAIQGQGKVNSGPGILVISTSLSDYAPKSLAITSNVISGNDGAGIELRGGFGQELVTTITGNLIGTDPQGIRPVRNGTGIIIDSVDNVVIGGTTQSSENTIVASLGDGILVTNSSKVSVLSNNIGYAPDSKNNAAFGNKGHGIHLTGVGDVNIGIDRGRLFPNTITYNGGDGIFLDGDGSKRNLTSIASIAGNWIGRDATGEKGNQGAGIRIINVLAQESIDPFETRRSEIHRNFIGGNYDEGILIERSRGVTLNGNIVASRGIAFHLAGANKTIATNNEFRSLGENAVVFDQGTTQTDFGNVQAGNLVIGQRNALRITEATNNTIVWNRFEGEATGVAVSSGENNLISRNEFAVGDQGLFIDLGGDGVTPNDSLDVDAGPNNLLNSPALISAAVRDGRTLLRGEYRGAADAEIVISWYVNGQFLAESVVQTDATGAARLALDLNEEFDAAAEFRASGTRFGIGGANTSEFSNAVFAMEAPDAMAKGAEPGQKARAQLVDAVTGEVILEQVPFGKGYRGGVSVATADVDGDGFTDLIATQRKGDGIVKIYSGLDGHLINSFWLGAAKGSAIRSLAVGDLDGDGSMEIVTGLAHTKGGRVLVHDALTGVFEADFAPFGVKIPSRLSVGLSDADGDGHPEIIVLSGSKRVVLDPISGQIEQLARITKGRAVA